MERNLGPPLEEIAALTLDPIVRLNAALKTLQILGQILKNFPGTLEGDKKLQIAETCQSLGLRALTDVLGLVKNHQEEVLSGYSEAIMRENAGITYEEALRKASETISGLCRSVAFGMIKRISYGIGSIDLEPTFDKLEVRTATTSSKLVRVSLKLDHSGNFPDRNLVRLSESLPKHQTAFSVLQLLAYEHFCIFQVDPSKRSRVCQALKISQSSQARSLALHDSRGYLGNATGPNSRRIS